MWVNAASTEAHPWIMLYYPVAMTVKRLAAEMHVASQRMVSHQQMPQLAGMEAAVAAEAEALLALPPAAWRGRGSTRLRVGLVSADFRLKVRAQPHRTVWTTSKGEPMLQQDWILKCLQGG